MGLLDMIGSLAGDASQGDNAKVMGGLVQALESHPGGIQSIINSFQQNGLGDHAAALANGESPTVTPDQVSQGLSGTGLIDKVAQHAGVSPTVVTAALTTVLPLVIAHFSQSGGGTTEPTAPGGLAGMAGDLLKKFV